jgi:predicted membrane-bound spermidine synthase
MSRSHARVAARTTPVVYRKRSRYQDIELRRHRGGLLLKLNGSPQVHSLEERLYHECAATLPMMLADHVNNVLILGGGDGLAARNVLEFSQARNVTLVELDSAMVKLWMENEVLRAMNNGALADPRLKVVIGDALAWLLRTRQTFDVIIHDVEDMFTEQPKELTVAFYLKFYEAIREKLRPGGVWVMTMADDESDVMLQALFDARRKTLPAAVQKDFIRKRSLFAKTRVLLESEYRHVREWKIDFPILGTHDTFFMSDAPMSRLYRRPARGLIVKSPLSKLI